MVDTFHVISVNWTGGKPGLWCRTADGMKVVNLAKGTMLNYELVKTKCIGPDYSTPCPYDSPDAPQCKKCAPIGVYPCVACNGSGCLLPKKRLECSKTDYVLYLAGFGDLLKVGVSQKSRLLQRWLEQGAQYACVIKEVRDGLLARRLENIVGKQAGVRMMVRQERKRLNDANKEAFESGVKRVVNKFSWLIRNPRIHDFTPFYPELPQKKPVLKDLIGESGGVRGHLLLLGEDVINLKKLVGWEIREKQIKDNVIR